MTRGGGKGGRDGGRFGGRSLGRGEMGLMEHNLILTVEAGQWGGAKFTEHNTASTGSDQHTPR